MGGALAAAEAAVAEVAAAAEVVAASGAASVSGSGGATVRASGKVAGGTAGKASGKAALSAMEVDTGVATACGSAGSIQGALGAGLYRLDTWGITKSGGPDGAGLEGAPRLAWSHWL